MLPRRFVPYFCITSLGFWDVRYSDSMRVTFVIGSLAAGGAQRVLILLSEGLIKHGHQVTVLTLNGRESDCFVLPEGVHRKALDISTRLQVILKFLKLRTAILSIKPDVVVSFIELMNILTLLSTRGLKIPIFVSERSAPSAFEARPFLNWLRARLYPFARRIIVQSQGALDYFSAALQVKTVIIPNPVVRPPETNLPKKTLCRPMLISVGRLHEVKQFDRLIAAFAMIKDKHADWGLTIVGDGPMKSALEQLGRDLDLGGRLYLPGYVKWPYEMLMQADLFVMASRIEGFPNALCEAMSCGLPVIATDCPTGPRAVIRDGIDGILVKNEDTPALAQAMDRLMSNEEERRRLASRSAEVIERFNIDRVVHLWEFIFNESLMEEKKKRRVYE